MTHSTNSVIFQTLGTVSGKQIGVMTLNMEKALNAINLEMVQLMFAQLKLWQSDDDIALILLDGAGEKAFCAGGDVRSIYHASIKAPGEVTEQATEFFEQEYRLDHLIDTYDKPVLVWGNGIVMGGGLGLMMGASHRVVTENSRIAMPEVTIGLYPDVGGSYFLNRMPGKLGLFLGLTAYNMNAADSKFVGIGNHYLNHDDKQALLDNLATLSWSSEAAMNHQLLTDELNRCGEQGTANLQTGLLESHRDQINRLVSGSLSEILQRVTETDCSEPWLERPIKTMLSGSPISLQLIYQQAQLGTDMSLAEVFRFELGLSVNCCAVGDFSEGVRALLIDKDRSPKWLHQEVKDIPEALIGKMMSSPWQQESHPLSNLV
ncbi:enoyl-CoA hydratase/isomerase family protein [Shewanella eurypsychrophilus]|uniref:3-hydroxyisobutyryl-CoA hydrolase n=1 Tax=Shewanella eurypsychrophilus TaxID=2593656 RepID=A0ABX6V4H6_9GAMM|nr:MULTISPECIES: enoyl-CoA hydratase/isomerase family protein [Shewanella]QFU21912.1 enoyl-CoA hydratase/isomerase family protein [Shewanella sp. YLB-09]QPG57201.1 enoyl-CoA hydratase/isomerase family protein [Shewanella eurypsychrophilus]